MLSNNECKKLVKSTYPESHIHRGVNELELLSHRKKGIFLAKGSNATKLYRAAATEILKRLESS